jgi:hypothetical protein
MYGRGSVVAMGAASALFAAANIGTIGKILAVVAAFLGGALVIRQILRIRRRA